MGPFLKLYLVIRTRKINSSDFKILNDTYNQLPELKNVKLIFSAFFFPPLTLGANSQFKNKIYISAEWAALLLTNNSVEIKNAFKITIGHELTHKDPTFTTSKYRGKKLKFINWVNEVYCDFGAASKMVNKDKNNLEKAIKFKIKNKPNNKETKTHPSWKQRLIYAQTGKFDEHLIRQIYEDSGCKNDTLLNEVIDFYKDKYIFLK